jgi:uncharacterized membrane protein YecN with MAPEG domain
MTTVDPPIISAFTAGILMLLQTALVFAAVNQRRQHGPSLGESSDPNVTRAIRRHGNLAENAAIFIACVALLEMLGGGSGCCARSSWSRDCCTPSACP